MNTTGTPNGFSSNGNDYSPSIEALKSTQKHEQILSKGDHSFELDKLQKETEYKIKKQQQDLGWFGRLFGNSENSSRNITAIICLTIVLGSLVLSIIVYCLERDVVFIGDIWGIVTPVITLAMGYLFGKK